MSTQSALGPLDPAVFDEILSDREDAYKRQGTVLKVVLAATVVLSVAVAGVGGAAAWALTKEREHLYLVGDDPVTHLRFLAAPAGPVNTAPGRQAAAEDYLRAAFEITMDDNYNASRRGSAIERMDANKEDKKLYYERALADLQAKRGYIYTIESAEFTPPSPPDASGLVWNVILTIKVADMRPNMSAHDPVKLEKYFVPLVMREVPPSVTKPRNLAGLVFLPAAPKLLEEKFDAARG